MDRTQMTGVLIMAGAVFALAGFVLGLVRRSYLAIAVPVALRARGARRASRLGRLDDDDHRV